MSADYFDIPAISATCLKAGATSMLHMRHMLTTGGKTQTSAMRFGSLVHLCALEPSVALETVVVYDGRRAGKEWDSFQDANAGKQIVKPEEYEELAQVLEAVRGNKHAAKILRGVKTEVPLLWNTKMYGDAKAKVDAIGPDYNIEVKTTRSISYQGFERQCWQIGYQIQLGWYAEGMARLNMPRKATYIIAIENVAPFDVVVYQADELMIDAGREQALTLAREYRECEKAGAFYGVAKNELRVLSLPAYAMPDIELI